MHKRFLIALLCCMLFPALAYAQTHPQRVTELVLRGIIRGQILELAGEWGMRIESREIRGRN